MARGSPLGETLEAIVRVVEAHAPGILGSVLLLDADGVHMRHGSAPSLPESFVRGIDREPIGARAGPCGAAAFRREPVFVKDIAADPLWDDYRHLAAPHDLRACWSTPIFDRDSRMLGILALYCREPALPAPEHPRLIEMAAQTAAIAIGKQREEDALEESRTRLGLAVRASNVGLWDWDMAADRTYYSAEWKSQLGYGENEISDRFDEWESRLVPTTRRGC